MAAQQAGMKLVIAPADNEGDVEEIPKPLLKKVKFKFVSSVEEVLELALVPAKKNQKSSPNGRTKSKVNI